MYENRDIFAYYVILINIIALLVMYVDKYRAKKNVYRISEKTLFVLSLVGGTYGIIYGMLIFRHKTLHKSFYFGVPLIQIVHLFLIYYIIIR